MDINTEHDFKLVRTKRGLSFSVELKVEKVQSMIFLFNFILVTILILLAIYLRHEFGIEVSFICIIYSIMSFSPKYVPMVSS